ncbi:MAG: hypothetical protein FWH51_05530, partial [Dehalococcoidia bacterium]|nr:hypothetical protein [Dehalococcoidia bacterium]
LRAIYLFDDKMLLVLNGGDKPIVIDDILLAEIEGSNAEFELSTMGARTPPVVNNWRRIRFRQIHQRTLIILEAQKHEENGFWNFHVNWRIFRDS